MGSKKITYKSKFSFILLLILLSQGLWGQNPFLPPTAFIPDGEPHVFEYKGEKRLFVYGSRDERITGYCGYGHDAWSAPVDDLTNWTNHGEIFNVQQVFDIGYGIVDEQHFGAPDCVYNPLTKKYYLYTFLGASYYMDGKQGPLPNSKNFTPGFEDFGPKCVMAVSNSPAGPFSNPVICDWPAANSAGAFDPSAIVDQKEGGSIRVYVYWGMKEGDRWAEVDPNDMYTIIDPKTRKPDRMAWHKTLDPEKITHSTVFEASSIKKIDENHYVFIYSSNELKSGLTYCYSNSPEGPWSYGGVIVRNNKNWKRGNNHGSIAKVKNQWYVVYHKPTADSKNRQAMIEPINVKIDGNQVIIPEVEMTSQGVHSNGLDAFNRYNANIACFRTNDAYIDGTVRDTLGLNPMVGINAPVTSIGFKYFNFGKEPISDKDHLQIKLSCEVLKPLTIQVFVSRPEFANNTEQHILIAESTIKEKDLHSSKKDILIPVKNIETIQGLNKIHGLKGRMAVFINFIGDQNDLCKLYEIEFKKEPKDVSDMYPE